MNIIINSKNFKSSHNLFQNRIKFYGSYFELKQIPQNLNSIEVAIVGRSNVGKSSLINAIVSNKNLAFVSKKPGCTVSVNLYKIEHPKIIKPSFLVDLPGYGYASRDKKKIKNVSLLLSTYLAERKELKKIYLLIDSRVGVQPIDTEFLNFFNQYKLCYQIVLTKIDNAKKSELLQLEELLTAFAQDFSNVNKTVLKVSSKDHLNLEVLREDIFKSLCGLS